MEKLRVGIIGTGNIALAMAYTLSKMEEAQLYAVASRSLEKADAFAGRFGGAKAYGDYRQLAQDDGVDLVYVASPHMFHHRHARCCLENHKPVLCEKAFTVNAAQAQDLVDLAHANNTLLVEAMWTRFMPFTKTIQQLVAEGAVGRPVTVMASHGQYLTHIPRLVEPQLAGGALLDLGVYTLTAASLILGGEVTGYTSDCVRWPTGVDAAHNITLHYGGLQNAMLTGSFLTALPQHWLVCGEEGVLQIEGISRPTQAKVLNKKGEVQAEHNAPQQITGYEHQVLACITALREGAIECPDMPHAESLRMMRLMDGLRAQWGLVYPGE